MKNTPKIIAVIGAYPDIGKGIFSASVCYLLQEAGFSILPVKFDGYINYSSGTMNPYHGMADSKYNEEEVFVLDDGYEADADSGYYERFTHNTFNNKSNITNGRLFAAVLEKERAGSLRRGEIFTYRFIRKFLADWILDEAKKTDIVVTEIGGTIGDKESEIIFDTLHLLQSQKKISLYTIMISPYLVHKESIGFEMSYRSKITRQAFEKSWRMGLTPNAIVLRTSQKTKIPANDLDYIGRETGLCDKKSVYIDSDCDSIYELPQHIHKQLLDKNILDYFELSRKPNKTTKRLEKYAEQIQSIKKQKKELLLGIFGKTVSDDSYISLKDAIEHASVSQNVKIKIVWLDESKNYKQELSQIDALIVGEGLDYVPHKIDALMYARENSIPCLGISFGCNLLVKEFCKNILKKKITIEELKETGPLAISKKNLNTGPIKLSLSSTIYYKKMPTNERIRHCSKYPEGFRDILMDSSLRLTGVETGTKQPVIFEDEKHPFYVGCMFHPEYISHPGYPHSLFVKLIQKGVEHKHAR